MNIGDQVRTFVEDPRGENQYDGVGIIRDILHEGYVIEKTTPIRKYNCIYKRDMIEKFSR
jgi:hypothetical protein